MMRKYLLTVNLFLNMHNFHHCAEKMSLMWVNFNSSGADTSSPHNGRLKWLKTLSRWAQYMTDILTVKLTWKLTTTEIPLACVRACVCESSNGISKKVNKSQSERITTYYTVSSPTQALQVWIKRYTRNHSRSVVIVSVSHKVPQSPTPL